MPARDAARNPNHAGTARLRGAWRRSALDRYRSHGRPLRGGIRYSPARAQEACRSRTGDAEAGLSANREFAQFTVVGPYRTTQDERGEGLESNLPRAWIVAEY